MGIETTHPTHTHTTKYTHSLSPSYTTQTNGVWNNLPNTRTQPHEHTQIQSRTLSLALAHYYTTPMVTETTHQTHDHIHTRALSLVHYLDAMVIEPTQHTRAHTNFVLFSALHTTHP